MVMHTPMTIVMTMLTTMLINDDIATFDDHGVVDDDGDDYNHGDDDIDEYSGHGNDDEGWT